MLTYRQHGEKDEVIIMEKEKKIFKVELEIEQCSEEAVIGMLKKLLLDERVVSFEIKESED